MPRKPITIERFYPHTKEQSARVSTDKGVFTVARFTKNYGDKPKYGIFTGKWNPFRRLK